MSEYFRLSSEFLQYALFCRQFSIQMKAFALRCVTDNLCKFRFNIMTFFSVQNKELPTRLANIFESTRLNDEVGCIKAAEYCQCETASRRLLPRWSICRQILCLHFRAYESFRTFVFPTITLRLFHRDCFR